MKIYCSGIGGIGLSAYASLQQVFGHQVMGSDKGASALVESLRTAGIPVTLDQSGGALPPDIDLFVYSEAVPPDAPERCRAKELEVRQVSYPEAVGELTRGKKLIAVCGTHGKSSTTAMAARLLIEAGKDPTVIVGTKVPELGGLNWRKGESDLFLLEACEYRHSFLQYDPSIILLTTCDGDHFDFYASQEAYRSSFVRFIRKLPADGTLITHLADPDCAEVAAGAGRETTDADPYPMIALGTPGAHMQRNAQLVLALAAHLEIPSSDAEKIVSGYGGSWRRMEVKGASREGATVVDDYGHHPVEIRATLQALRGAYPGRRLVCVFQPHTHDRTRTLYKEFTASFHDADLVIIPNIYVARKDIEHGEVSVPAFVKDIAKESKTEVLDGRSLTRTEEALRGGLLRKGDVLVCMGAGDITSLAERMVSPRR